eukprot:12451508-Alexandrium_andersonii.AAC.1
MMKRKGKQGEPQACKRKHASRAEAQGQARLNHKGMQVQACKCASMQAMQANVQVVQACKCASMQVYKHASVQVQACKCASVQAYKCNG